MDKENFSLKWEAKKWEGGKSFIYCIIITHNQKILSMPPKQIHVAKIQKKNCILLVLAWSSNSKLQSPKHYFKKEIQYYGIQL